MYSRSEDYDHVSESGLISAAFAGEWVRHAMASDKIAKRRIKIFSCTQGIDEASTSDCLFGTMAV